MAISHAYTNRIPDGTNTNIVRPSDWNSAHNQYYTLSGNTLGVSTVSGTNVVLQGGGNVSLSGTGQTVVVYGGGGGTGGGAVISAGTQFADSGTVYFANSNGISFGMSDNSRITASYTVPTAYVSSVNGSSGAISLNVGSSLSASTNGSSITFGLASNITTALQSANANYLTSQSNQAFSASGGSSTFQTLNFANSNGVTFSNSGGSVVASYTVPATTGFAGTGFTSATTTGTAIVGTLDTNGLNLGVPAYLTSAGAGGGAALSAGTQSANTGTITFANSNGISFGMSGSNQITASYTTSPVSNITAGNNISLSSAGSTLTINAQAVALGAGTETATSGTVIFSNSNGISFGLNAGTLTASYSVPTQSVQTQASGAIAGTGFTSTTTAGTAITASLGTNGLNMAIPVYLTTAAAAGNAIAVTQTGGGTTAAAGTVQFATGNGISFGLDAASSVMTASYGFAVADTITSRAIRNLYFYTGNGITFGFTTGAGPSGTITASHNGLTNFNVSAGTTSNNLSNLVFSNTNGVTFGLNGSTITASAAGGGGAMYANLSGNTAGDTTASGSTLNLSGINITLSGTNNSQIAISAPATSSLVGVNGISIATAGSTISISNAQFTLSGYNHYNDVIQAIGQVGQGILNFDPINLANPVQMDRIGQLLYNSNTTGSHTLSMYVGLYTRSISSLSLFQSVSTSLVVNSVWASYAGIKLMTIPFTTTLPANDYWLGVVSSTASAGTNGTYSQILQSNLNSNFSGIWGTANNATVQATLGQGVYSAATNGLPGSVAFSQITGTGSNALRPPVVMFISGTV